MSDTQIHITFAIHQKQKQVERESRFERFFEDHMEDLKQDYRILKHMIQGSVLSVVSFEEYCRWIFRYSW